MKDAQHWSEALRTRNLKATNSRVEVLNEIEGYGKAMPYSQIQHQLQSIDRVTLYRTLNALIESGLIHKVSVEDNETFYAICSQKCTTKEHHHQHVHFRCTQCKEVTCVQASGLETLSLPGYQVASFEIQAVGVCSSCVVLR